MHFCEISSCLKFINVLRFPAKIIKCLKVRNKKMSRLIVDGNWAAADVERRIYLMPLTNFANSAVISSVLAC